MPRKPSSLIHATRTTTAIQSTQANACQGVNGRRAIVRKRGARSASAAQPQSMPREKSVMLGNTLKNEPHDSRNKQWAQRKRELSTRMSYFDSGGPESSWFLRYS